MRQIVLSLADQAVVVQYPESLQDDLRTLLGGCTNRAPKAAPIILVQEDGSSDRYILHPDGRDKLRGLDKGSCIYALLGEVGHSLLTNLSAGVAFHAGAVSLRNLGIVLPGTSGSGKSSLTAWFIDNGFDYLTDEIVVFGSDVPNFTAFARPLVVKSGSSLAIASLPTMASAPSIAVGSNKIILPTAKSRPPMQHQCRLIVFPRFAEGAELTIEPLTAAQTGLELMACNVNARNLVNHGFDIVTSIARSVPAVMLRYGNFELLHGVVDAFAELVLQSDLDSKRFCRIFRSFGTTAGASIGPEEENSGMPSAGFVPSKIPAPTPRRDPFVPSKILAPTPRKDPKKLTIGMATYDDYDGVYFTLQALRMYHPEIIEDAEFLVVDNHPEGPCAEPLKQLETTIANYRYIPFNHWRGTTTKGFIFEEANAEFVLCIDCHIFIVPGAVKKLISYCQAHPDSKDLLQGPLVYDDLETCSTHFEPKWREGMYGCWATDDRGKDPDVEPFEIPMQGLGLFACRRLAWPGFNRRFRGFGGEEGYLHEKFRQAGGRTLCLPFLRWMHRFDRPMGVPYMNTWGDRLRNYLIGFTELGWDTAPVEEHFNEFLGPSVAGPIIERAKAEIAQFDADES